MAKKIGPFELQDKGSATGSPNRGLMELVGTDHTDSTLYFNFGTDGTTTGFRGIASFATSFPAAGNILKYTSFGIIDDAGIAASDVVTLTGSQTLTNKTLTTPTIGNFTNATHNHQNNAGGGSLDAAAIGSGTMATARLGSGTANSSTFLRGDQTWAAPGAMPWTVSTSGLVAMSANNGYIANGSGPVIQYLLPASASVGDMIWLHNIGSSGFIITQNSGQTIRFNTVSTTTTSGAILVNTVGHTLLLLCTIANTDFSVIASTGERFTVS